MGDFDFGAFVRKPVVITVPDRARMPVARTKRQPASPACKFEPKPAVAKPPRARAKRNELVPVRAAPVPVEQPLARASTVEAFSADIVERVCERMAVRLDELFAKMNVVDDEPAPPSGPPPDMKALAEVFRLEQIETITDASRRSTVNSAIKYWFGQDDAADLFPSEEAIAACNRRMLAHQSSDYARSRTHVLHNWRKWLLERGIEAAPTLALPAPTTLSLSGDEIPLGRIDSISERAMKQLVEGVHEAMFGGESAIDYWGVVVRRVAHIIGPKGMAKLVKTDEKSAKTWIQQRRVPKHAQEKLEHVDLLCRIRIAKSNGYSLDDLDDGVMDVEQFFVGEGEGSTYPDHDK